MTTADLAVFGPEFTADPYPTYARLRQDGPVHRLRGEDGTHFWLVVGYEEARRALADPALSKSPATVGVVRFDQEVIGSTLLSVDPPDHTRLRRLVAREFTARRAQRLAPRVQEITDGLLDAMVPRGRADLVEHLAFPLPIIVICELLGVPATDRDAFRAWSDEIVAPTSAEAGEAAVLGIGAYLDGLIADKRRSGPSDDLLSALIGTASDAEPGEERLTGTELRSLAYLLLIAGHETTVNLIAGGVRALLAHPEQLALLRSDPGLLDGAVEEMLRYDGPVENATLRFTTEPVTYGGTTVPAGETVLVCLAGGDRDPARFPEPDRFDIRRDARGHLAFGHGIHFCLGAPLARLEARTALASLLTRCPGLAADPDAGPEEWLPGLLIRGTRRLPVRW
ncbi:MULTISPECIES: cytochrome P450 [unclassified Streptomyces]|uniref:cytochrome P450 family protein n=1 Tax=unclassified Streptomyces TaxID=2593676 RepID=UPI0033F0BB64